MGELCKIILVDDSDDDVFLFKRALTAHPRLQLIWHGQDGNEAIEYLNGSGKFADRDQYPWPDVVVLDLKMPGVDGFQVLQWMQGKANMPVALVLSSSDLPEDKQRAAQLGATMYTTKPFEPDMFDHVMRRVVRLCDRKRESEQIPGASLSLPLHPNQKCSDLPE